MPKMDYFGSKFSKIAKAKLIRFGLIWLDLSEIWAKLRQN